MTVPDSPAGGSVTREKLEELTRLYYANITCADRNMGRVFDALDELGLAKHTVVIFIGDNGEKPHMRMIRTDDWKLVLYHDENGRPLDAGTRHELFDLKTDPSELTDLHGKRTAQNIQRRLETRLLDWMRKTGVMKQAARS